MKTPIVEFGYLTVTVDFSKKTPMLRIDFNDRTNTAIHDTVRVNLVRGAVR